MNIRPATLWRACFPRSLSTATLAIGEPSSSKTRPEASRFANRTSYSTHSSDNGPPQEKSKLSSPGNTNLSGGHSEKKKPFDPTKRQNMKPHRRRPMNPKKKKDHFHNESQNTSQTPKPSDNKKSGLRLMAEQVARTKATASMNAKASMKAEAQDQSPTGYGYLNPIPSKSSFQEHATRVLAREDAGHIREVWAKEPWSSDSQDDKVNANRRFPPHEQPETFLNRGMSVANIGSETLPVLTDVAPKTKHQPIDELSHGLDRVLFNPGVHWLQDPRSHVYNFTPWLEKIPKVNDFAFERLTGFVRSSRDEELRALALQEGKKFAGSTSSLSGMLSHIYFLLTRYKEIDCMILSQHFQSEPTTFTPGQRMPALVKLNYKDEIYAIDSHSSEWDDPDKNVLTWMGTLLENFLTKSPEAFNAFMRDESSPPSELKEEPALREAYRYSKSDRFVMRSQLDCHDSRLPGTGVFDIKTRACVSIRMDILNYEENAGYLIKSQHGILQSFEKEYYDLIRSAFLKYSFQVRIGNMDGVFVAYHNTERIFGFQYISLDEMDERLLGPTPGIGDKLFHHCVKVLEGILEEAASCFPGESVLCLMETAANGKLLNVFVEPAEWDDTEGEKPIKQLRVVVEHELDDIPASADAALMSTHQQWTVQYKITSLAIPDELIRDNYDTIMQRKKRTLVLPSSVSLEGAEQYWQNLNFNNKNKMLDAKLQPFNPDSFSLAQESVERYRRLARQGRLETQMKESRMAGKPKIVYGHGVYEPTESPFFPPRSELSQEGNISELDQETSKPKENPFLPPSLELSREATLKRLSSLLTRNYEGDLDQETQSTVVDEGEQGNPSEFEQETVKRVDEGEEGNISELDQETSKPIEEGDKEKPLELEQNTSKLVDVGGIERPLEETGQEASRAVVKGEEGKPSEPEQATSKPAVEGDVETKPPPSQ